jgi:copper(I)-binding protein
MTIRHLGLSACLIAVMLLGASLFGGTSVMSQTGTPSVSNAWVRLPAATGRPGAGYMVVQGGAQADALVSASSPSAERVEMHSMSTDGGVMRMRAEPSIAIPAGQSVAFQPGGNHLMLFGLDPRLKPGERVQLTLRFQSGATVNVQAQARAAAG